MLILSLFFMGGWLILVPILYSFLFGWKSSLKGNRRFFTWLVSSFLVSIVSLVIAGYLFRPLENIDSSPPYPNFDIPMAVYGSTVMSFFLLGLTIPSFYLGVRFRSRKR